MWTGGSSHWGMVRKMWSLGWARSMPKCSAPGAGANDLAHQFRRKPRLGRVQQVQVTKVSDLDPALAFGAQPDDGVCHADIGQRLGQPGADIKPFEARFSQGRHMRCHCPPCSMQAPGRSSRAAGCGEFFMLARAARGLAPSTKCGRYELCAGCTTSQGRPSPPLYLAAAAFLAWLVDHLLANACSSPRRLSRSAPRLVTV